MSGASLYTGSGFWSAEGHPLIIEYAAHVMERIRTEAIEGFNRTGAGGFEVGGLLFGTCEGDVVRILAHRPFACEYAMGPAFALSERDLPRFEALLRLPELDPDLDGLDAVGWYHTHTRQGVFLSERDLETHNRFFPGKGPVALVLRPDVFGSVRAGFFFREDDGAIRGDSSYCEFDVAPPPRAPAFDPPRRRFEPDRPTLPPMPGLGLRDERDDEPRPRVRRGFPWVALLAALALALAAASAALYYGILLPRPSMLLEVKDLGGSVRITWDRDSRPISQARAGLLEIADGADKVEMHFDQDRLHDGSVIYTPTSSTLDVRLRVDRASGGSHEEYVRFVGPPRAAPARRPEVPALPESLATGLAEPRGEPSRRVVEDNRSRSAPSPERPKVPEAKPVPKARFQLPAQTARTEPGASSLPAPPALRPAGGPRIEQAPANTVVGSVPGPPPVLPPSEKPKPVYTGPSRGRLIWTGEVRSNVPISISGRHANYGSVSGELPGVPVRIQVHPADLSSRGLTVFTLDPTYRRVDSAIEPPGPHNGWNPTVYTFNDKRARSVTVTEAPSATNNWKGLTLRGDLDWLPVIIIDWQLASPQ